MALPNTYNVFKGGRERYQRPHCFNLAVGTSILNLSPAGRIPVISFLVQSDLNNTGVVNIGDGHVSLVNGVQLDPGRAWVFGVSNEGLIASGLVNTPISWADSMEAARQHAGGSKNYETKLYLDIADFFVIGDTAAPLQNIRVFWSSTTEN